MTQCTTRQLEFHGLGRREIVARFDGGEISSDGGALLLREVDQRLGLLSRLAQCFTDYRDPELIEHDVHSLLGQRIYGIAMGYEDLNDHDQLMRDTLLAVIVGKSDPSGQSRLRERDKGAALASSSTLNRLELSRADQALASRYKRVVGDYDSIDRLFVDLFLESQDPPDELWLDLDATNDPLHGLQEGRFFHGYYGEYCYLPLYIFCGEHLLCARLRTADQDASAGSVAELERIVGQIRSQWPDTRIGIRADSGFSNDTIMSWCEDNKVLYVLGLSKNSRLNRAIGREMAIVSKQCDKRGEAVRLFRNLRYRTRRSWSRERRVVAKAEHIPGKANPRFVVTNVARSRLGARALYEELYCERGEMENRIKEQQLHLFADRTSSATIRANQLRLYFSSFAYVLMQGLRWMGLHGSELEKAQCQSIRLKLFKIGARISTSTRKVWISLSESYPYQALYARIVRQLHGYPIWKPG